MSKKLTQNVTMANGPEIIRYIVEYYDVQDIEGKLLTIVESIGLQQKQEEAVKGLVRQTLWDVIHRPWRVTISNDLFKQAWIEQEKRRETEPKLTP